MKLFLYACGQAPVRLEIPQLGCRQFSECTRSFLGIQNMKDQYSKLIERDQGKLTLRQDVLIRTIKIFGVIQGPLLQRLSLVWWIFVRFR